MKLIRFIIAAAVLLLPSLAYGQGLTRLCAPGINDPSCIVADRNNPFPVTASFTPSATGGAKGGFIITAATSNSNILKATPGTLYAITVTTTGGNVDAIRFYDSTTHVACGTTPKLVYRIPSGTAGVQLNNPLPSTGITFLSGIVTTITSGSSINDCGAASAGHHVSYGIQ